MSPIVVSVVSSFFRLSSSLEIRLSVAVAQCNRAAYAEWQLKVDG